MRAPHTSKGKTREEHERATRAALLDAAESLFAEFGHDGLTNRAIAERAGTTTQPIYTFFGGHDALVLAMYERAIDGFSELVTENIRDDLEGQDSARVMWKSSAMQYRSYCHAYPGRFRLVRERAPREAAGVGKRLVNLFNQLMDLGMESLSTGPLRERMIVSMSAVNGFIVAEQQGFIRSDRADECFNDLVNRLCVEPEIVQAAIEASTEADSGSEPGIDLRHSDREVPETPGLA